jgi:hypothetical protein
MVLAVAVGTDCFLATHLPQQALKTSLVRSARAEPTQVRCFLRLRVATQQSRLARRLGLRVVAVAVTTLRAPLGRLEQETMFREQVEWATTVTPTLPNMSLFALRKTSTASAPMATLTTTSPFTPLTTIDIRAVAVAERTLQALTLVIPTTAALAVMAAALTD